MCLLVFGCRNRAAVPALPALVKYENLPGAFNQALQEAHAKAGQPAAYDPAALRQLARLYHANRLFREARTIYAILAAGPSGLEARDHYLLADIAQNENDLAAAQVELRAALALTADYLPARVALAESLFKSGDEESARKEYEAVEAREPDQPQASVGLARLELQRGDDAAAVARLERLLGRHPDAIAGAALLAKVLERKGQVDRAAALSQWSQQKPPAPLLDPWLDALLADCYDVQRLSLTFEEYFKLGRMDEAAPLLDRLAVLDPKGPITMMFAGVSHAKGLQHITAVREYYAALGNNGDPEKICPYLIQSLLAIGNVSEAATVIAGYYAKMPESLPLAKAYADVALRQNDDRTARTLLEKILLKEPYLSAQNMSLARIYWAAGERDAAAVCLQRVAAGDPNEVPSRALLGEYHLGRGDPFAAIRALQPARERAANQPPAVQQQLGALLGTAYLHAGNAESEKGRLAEAAVLADQAVALLPGELNAYALQAGVSVQLGQFHRAAGALEKLAALQPGNPTILLSWGDVLYQDGKPTQAGEKWRQALPLVAAGDRDLRLALEDRLAGRITAETFK